jgi:hypothetical protein
MDSAMADMAERMLRFPLPGGFPRVPVGGSISATRAKV